MHRYPESTSIVAAGYSADREVFRAHFLGDRVYDYLNVPADVYRRFLDAESKGRFVNFHIKPHYEYREVIN